MTPYTYWSAGLVNRWHTNENHALRNSQDLVDAHSARVARLCLIFWPEDAALVVEAIEHDLPEFITGDIPAPAKRNMGLLYYSYEERVTEDLGLSLSKSWRLSFCDSLDAFLWARLVVPEQVATRIDWRAQEEALRHTAATNLDSVQQVRFQNLLAGKRQ